jgi:hypothetical protein
LRVEAASRRAGSRSVCFDESTNRRIDESTNRRIDERRTTNDERRTTNDERRTANGESISIRCGVYTDSEGCMKSLAKSLVNAADSRLLHDFDGFLADFTASVERSFSSYCCQ